MMMFEWYGGHDLFTCIISSVVTERAARKW